MKENNEHLGFDIGHTIIHTIAAGAVEVDLQFVVACFEY